MLLLLLCILAFPNVNNLIRQTVTAANAAAAAFPVFGTQKLFLPYSGSWESKDDDDAAADLAAHLETRLGSS